MSIDKRVSKLETVSQAKALRQFDAAMSVVLRNFTDGELDVLAAIAEHGAVTEQEAELIGRWVAVSKPVDDLAASLTPEQREAWLHAKH